MMVTVLLPPSPPTEELEQSLKLAAVPAKSAEAQCL